jgi:hypothetical protein
MTEEFKCPEFIIHTIGKGFYQNIKSHPKEEQMKKCSKDNSSYSQD